MPLTNKRKPTTPNVVVMALTNRLGRFLSRWGVDPEQYQWLLQTSLKLDFRSENLLPARQGWGSTASALVITIGLYVFFSGLLSAALAFSGAGTWVFSGVLLASAMMMLAMSVLIEFGSTVINPDDFQILGPRPVSSRTYFAVKFSNLLFYILVFSAALNVLPAFFGLGCPDANWYFPVAYLAAGLLASLFVAGAIVALYGWLLRLVHYEKFKDIITYCQVLFSFMFFFISQLVPQYMEYSNSSNGVWIGQGWVAALPPFWFASLIEVTMGRMDIVTAGLAVLGVLAPAIFFTVLVKRVSLDYAEYVSRMAVQAGSKKTKAARASVRRTDGWFNRTVLRGGEERAFFYFFLTMLKRNRHLKLQLYPNLGILVALIAVALFQRQELSDPFVDRAGGAGAFLPIMGFLFAGMGLYAVLPYSDEYRGGWIFQVAPLRRREQVLKGIKKATGLALFVPIFLLNVIVFSFFWPLSHALWHSLYGLAVGYLFLQLLLFQLNTFPFTRKPEKGTQNVRVLVLVVFMPIIGVLIFLPRWVAGTWTKFFLTLGAVAAVGLVLGRLNNLVYARRRLTVGDDVSAG